MRKATIRILTFAWILVLSASFALSAYAAEINLGVTITSNIDAGTITVTVDNSDDTNAVLSATPARLEIPCNFDAAYTVYDGKVLSDTVLDTVSEKITFPVAKGGTYTIHNGAPLQIAFDSNGGSTVAGQTIPVGGKVTEPNSPTKEGLLFGGWYRDSELITKWNFETDTTDSAVTLYAKWVEGILITFDSKDGSAVESQTILPGSKITPPQNPTRSGYRFDYWYNDSTQKTEWNFDTAVNAATTLYAKWTDVKTGSVVISGASSWNPAVDAATLDAAANAQGDADDTIELRLTIQDLVNVPEADLKAIETLALGRELDCLDMKLECRTNDGSFTDIGKTNSVLLKITLDFDSADKKNIAVFRYHNGKAELLPTGTQGERFELDQTNKNLTIYASKFSTYAIGYTEGNDTLDPYQFTKGHNSSWAKDSSRNLVFVCKAPYNLLEKMTINGQEISLAYAEISEDGTQITLKPDFLKNLPRGKYYLELYYKNGGYAIAAFTVTRSSGISNTGDLFNPVLWGSLLGVSVIGILILIVLKKRKK